MQERGMNKASWTFPEVDGLMSGTDGDSSASNFRGDPIKGLCKENIQNPIDARYDDEPAIVEFHAFSIPATDFPGRAELETAIHKARETANPEGNSREEIFFSSAEKSISNSEITFLRISDFNTTGLLGSEAKMNDRDALRKSNWLHLVRGMGITTKRSGNGGSHGKGKSAAIANSALSTIFYNTMDLEGKEAFQGVAYLPIFIDDDMVMRNGTGFFGSVEKPYPPIRENTSLDPSYTRETPGTDIYIAGFQGDSHWEELLIVAVLNEYLMSLYKGILEVRVGGCVINKQTLPSIVKRYTEIVNDLQLDVDENYADICWDAINNPEISSGPDNISIDGISAELEIYIKTGAGPKKIDQIRQIGMRISAYDGKRQFPFPFVGCLYISGVEINQLLAGIEDETHCKWEPARAGDKQQNADKCIKKLQQYIREKIKQLYNVAKDQKLEAEGVEEYFPIDLDDENATVNSKETIDSNIISVQIKKYKATSGNDEYVTSLAGQSKEDLLSNDSTPISDENLDPEQSEQKGPANDSNLESPSNPDLDPPTVDDDHGVNNAPRKKLRMMRQKSIGSNGKYTLALQPIVDCEQAFIQIVLSGEEKDEPIDILSAKEKDTGKEVVIGNEFIGPVRLNANEITKILVETRGKNSYSLGVNVYAY